MAKSNTTKYLLASGLAAGGILLFIYFQNQRQRALYAAQLESFRQQNGSFEPPSNTPKWMQWVQLILGAYGSVKTLWEPGGPFYKSQVPNPQQDPAGFQDLITQLRQTRFIP